MDKQEVYHRMLKTYGREGLADLCFVIDCKIEKVREEMQAMVKTKATKFVKPTPEEIKEYAKTIDKQIDAEQFYDFHESKGWMIGKNKMKDWKAAVRTWAKRDMDAKPKRVNKAQVVCIKCKKPATAFIEKQCLECYYGR